MIKAALVEVLRTDPDVSSLAVGDVHELVVPQGVDLPAISYRLVSDVKRRNLDLSGKRRVCRLQINALAADAGECDRLTDAINNALDSFTGTVQGVRILTCFEQDSKSDIDSQPGDYRNIQDFLINYEKV